MRRAIAVCITALLAAWPLHTEAASTSREAARPGGDAPVLFSADEVQYDEDLGLVVAKGNVEISQRNQILLADTVTYNQRTDTVTASGHVSLLQPAGDIVFADFVELHDNLRDGFIKNVRLLLSDRSRLAGNTARRIEGNRTEVRRAVYSPCELCRTDPTRPPLWQIKAGEIIHDKELQLVEYRDAVMEIGGIPIFYSPYFSHPDPSVKRRSGFLAPSIGIDSSNGFRFALPYYWVLGPDKDATFRPMFTASGGTVLGGEYRQHFGNGRLQADGSVAFGSRSRDGTLADPGPPESGLRGHFFGAGEFDLDQNWRTGFDIRRASDQTYLSRYHFLSTTTFLTSRAYAENFGANSYGNVSAYSFQSLHAGVGDSTQPIALPLADYNYLTQPDALGGRWSFEGNTLNLVRIRGTDTRRLSLGTEWRLPFDGPIGDRYSFSAGVRGDGYHSNNLLLSPSDTATHTELAGRLFPQVGLEWRYPWVRHGESYSQIIEPIAAAFAAPRGGNPVTIPNEDSQGFEFDETSLFRRNRFPGFDRVDTGQRVDYGLRAGIYGNGGGSSRLLVGQSYSLQRNTAFPAGSGVNDRFSDIVGRVVISPNSFLDLVYRFRLDKSDLALRRQEAGINGGPSNLRLSLTYIDIAPIPGIAGSQAQKQINSTLSATLTRYWSAVLTDTLDLTPGLSGSLNSGAAVTYRDDCLSFTTSITESKFSDRDIRPGLSVLFTVVFRNLGEIGARASGGSSS